MDEIVIPTTALALMHFIAHGESGDDYNVIYGHHEHVLAHPITSMALDDLIIAQATWGRKWGSSAAGFLQFMPATLKMLRGELGLTGKELFSPDLQQRLGYRLLLNRGYAQFLGKQLPLVQFAKNLAEEWASLPVLQQTQGAHRIVNRGQSYYSGDGLNKALVAPEAVEKTLEALIT